MPAASTHTSSTVSTIVILALALLFSYPSNILPHSPLLLITRRVRKNTSSDQPR